MKPKAALRIKRRIFAACAMFACQFTDAQTFTWDGGGGDDNWGTGANWADNAAPGPGTTVDLVFAGTTRLTPILNYTNGDDFRDITFASGAGVFTIANTGTNGIDWFGSIINDSSSNQTIGFRLYQSTSNSILANTGDIVLNSSALLFRNSQNLTLTAANGRTITLSGVIANGSGAGSSILLNGAGTVRFAAANTFTSGIAIDSGTAIASANNAALGTGTAFVGNGGTGFANTNASLLIDQSGLTIANAITTNKADTGIGFGAGTRTIGGSFTSGSSTFSGNISLNGGAVLTAGSGGTVIFDGIIQNGVDTGNVSRSVTINASGGTIQFNKINTYTGTTTINSGLVDVRAGTAGGSAVWGGGGITINQGATLFFNPTNQAIQNTPGFSVSGAITLSGGAGTSTLRFGGNDNKFVLSGGITGQAGVSQTLALIQGGILTNGDRQSIQVTGPVADGSGGTLNVSVDFSNASGTAQRAYVSLTGQNTFTGDLTITNSKGLNGTGNNPGAWVTIGGIRHDGFTAPTLVQEGTGYLGAAADYSGNISISNGTGGLTTLSFLTSANQILRGVISGTGSLHNQGSGTLTLTNANTFSGNTTIVSGAGALIMGHALALQNSPLVTTSGANTLTLFGTPSSLQLGGLSGASGSLGTIITSSAYNNVNALTLNPQAGVSVTYGGALVNGASGMTVTKTGAGTQVLSGTNTYSGGTTISNGMLHFTRLVAQPASGAVAVGTGGTLAVNVGGTGEWTTGLSGNGTIGGLLGGLGGQSGGTVTFSGNATLGFDTTNGFVNPNGIATQTYSGSIANAGTTLGITKLGTNILFLTGNNTYAGAITVNGGRLVLTGSNSYAGGSFINGGMLQFGKLLSQPASGTVAVNTGGTLAVNLGGTGEWTTGASGNGTIGGLLAGLGGQSGGTVNYTGNVALGFDTSNATTTQTYSGAIANLGTSLGITKLGTGTLTLSGANTYTGPTRVEGGTLLLDLSGTGSLSGSSALVLGGGNFQMQGKTTGTTTQTLGALTLIANTNNTITLDSNGGTGTTLTLANSNPTRGVGSTLLIDRSIANTTLTSTFGLTAAAQTTTQGILGYALVKDTTGIGFAANVGGSIVRYTGADSTFSGTSNSATTNFRTAPTGTSTTGSPYLTAAASPSYNSLHIDTASATGANFLSLNGTVTLTQRALIMTGNNSFTIQGGTQLGANNHEVIVHQTGSGILTISSRISSGSGSLTKNGTGTLVVTNSGNNYTGSTTLNAGTLQYASRTAFGTSTLYLAGGTKLQKITEEANIVGNAMANNIILTGGQVEMNVDFSTAKDQWFTGVVSGIGSLRITASGIGRQVAFSGNNTFTGGVTLDTTNAAWIRLANANGLGSGTLTINQTGGNQTSGLGADGNLTSGVGVANNIVINPGATFNLGGGNAVSGNMLLSGVISGAGNLNKSDNAPTPTTYILSGANTYTGSTRVTTGTLQLGNGGTTGSLTGTSGITNDSNITVNRSNAFTQAIDLNNKAITGTGSFTQAGTGTTTLTQANNYTGATLVSAGTLLVNGSLGNSAVTVNGGTFGGSGAIGSTLNILNGSLHVVDLFDAMQVTGTVTLYAGFGIDDLVGLTWGSVAEGTYTLINGTLGAGVFAGLANNSLATAYDIGGGRSAYFKEGSLQLVVIPEPRAALLGGLGVLMLLRRRRA